MTAEQEIVRQQKPIRLSADLILLTKSYQNDRRLPSFNAAVIELLEHSLRAWAMNLPEFPAEQLDAAVMPPL